MRWLDTWLPFKTQEYYQLQICSLKVEKYLFFSQLTTSKRNYVQRVSGDDAITSGFDS